MKHSKELTTLNHKFALLMEEWHRCLAVLDAKQEKYTEEDKIELMAALKDIGHVNHATLQELDRLEDEDE